MHTISVVRTIDQPLDQDNLSWLTNAEDEFAMDKAVFAFVQKQVIDNVPDVDDHIVTPYLTSGGQEASEHSPTEFCGPGLNITVVVNPKYPVTGLTFPATRSSGCDRNFGILISFSFSDDCS
jgi:hypothetical protein